MRIVQEDGKTYWHASHWGMHEIHENDFNATIIRRLKAEVRAHFNMHPEDNYFFNAFKRWQGHPSICRGITSALCKALSAANVR